MRFLVLVICLTLPWPAAAEFSRPNYEKLTDIVEELFTRTCHEVAKCEALWRKQIEASRLLTRFLSYLDSRDKLTFDDGDRARRLAVEICNYQRLTQSPVLAEAVAEDNDLLKALRDMQKQAGNIFPTACKIQNLNYLTKSSTAKTLALDLILHRTRDRYQADCKNTDECAYVYELQEEWAKHLIFFIDHLGSKPSYASGTFAREVANAICRQTRRDLPHRRLVETDNDLLRRLRDFQSSAGLSEPQYCTIGVRLP